MAVAVTILRRIHQAPGNGLVEFSGLGVASEGDMTLVPCTVGWVNCGLFLGALSFTVGACTRVEPDDGDETERKGAEIGSGGAGMTPSSTRNSGTTASTTGKGGTTAHATGGKGGTTAIATTAKGGTPAKTTTSLDQVTACPGVPASDADASGLAGACNGAGAEVEPMPVDMIILMDRSISNSYVVGSDSATPAETGQLTRWEVLTSAMDALAIAPKAQKLGASITFFSSGGGYDETENCDATTYAKPIVPLGLLSETGQQIVTAMKALSPSGLTPTVPALTGVYQYAMSEKQKDSEREKVVVLISDGFPTQCKQRSPSDVINVIGDAASAKVPIRTFVIGVGSPKSMDDARFNLQNYARAGRTGKPPYVLDETASADAVRDQLVTALLNISSSSMDCEYEVTPPTPGLVVDTTRVKFTFTPEEGAKQEIPKVAGASTCAKSPNGGWYFDDPITPKKITVCPCTCANFSAGRASVIFGCKPYLEYL